MAKATSLAECQQRHVAYHHDIFEQLDTIQGERLQRAANLIPPGSTVLDIGCNSGALWVYLEPKGCQMQGIDINPELVAKANGRFPAVVGVAEDLSRWQDDEFEVAVLSEILEHLYDPHLVLAEAARVASSLIVGDVPTERSRQWGAHTVVAHPYHVRSYHWQSLHDQLSPYGQVEIIEWADFYFFAVRLP